MLNEGELRFERAERILHRRIERGLYAAGSKLPSETSLSRELEVSRSSLRKALEALEAQGLVEHRPGEPWWVSDAVDVTQRDNCGIVALIVPDVPRLEELRSRVSGHRHVSWITIVHALADSGFNVLQLAPSRLQAEGVSSKVAAMLAGVVISYEACDLAFASNFVQACIGEDIPVIVQVEGREFAGVDQVRSDHLGGTVAMMEWLAERGIKRIQRIWRSIPTDWLRPRDEAYVRVCRERSLPCLEPLVWRQADMTAEERLEDAVVQLGEVFASSHPPEALMLINDTAVDVVAQALRRLGLRPNEDVALCGFDYFWRYQRHDFADPVPPLLTVDKCTPAVGRIVVSMLESRLANPHAKPFTQAVPARLIVDEEQLARWRAAR